MMEYAHHDRLREARRRVIGQEGCPDTGQPGKRILRAGRRQGLATLSALRHNPAA